jgi:hypothetical protein
MNAANVGDVIVASVHRLMNDYRRKLESPAGDRSMRFECECDRVECSDSFRMNIDDYDKIRARAGLFAVTLRHHGSDEPVVETTESYSVVRKAATAHEFQTVVPQTTRSAETVRPRDSNTVNS